MAVKRKMMDVSSDGKLTDPNKLEQGTQGWLDWRARKIGASDAPALMGLSPWKTPFELWSEKTGLIQPPEPNGFQAAAMLNGTKKEPRARELYIQQTGIEVVPDTFTHPQYDFLACSLDGWHADSKHIVEIKVPNKEDIKLAKAGRVPKKYFYQLTHQFLVTDGASLDYVTLEEGAHKDDDKIYIVSVDRNPVEEAKLLQHAINFWDHVQSNTPYGFTLDDLDKTAQRLVKEMEKAIQAVQAIAVISRLVKEDANEA